MKPDFRETISYLRKKWFDSEYGAEIAADIEEELHAAYAAGLERAAEIAETGTRMPSDYGVDTLSAWSDAEDCIAAAIRAEKENDHG